MQSNRKSPSTQTLAANGIQIRRHEWPKHVLFLASQLLEPFSNLVPLSKLGYEWDEANIPQDAFFLDESPKLRRKREKMIDSALAIKRECRLLMQHNIVDEASWNEIWTNATRDHIIETELENHGKGNHHTLSRRDNMLFSKTGKIYGNDKYDVTYPKPDSTFAFPSFCSVPNSGGCMENKCFDQGILKALQKSGLISSPFSEKHDVCFPWGVYEGKSRKRGKLDPESQAANAGVACIKILERLAKGPLPPSPPDDKSREIETKVPDPPEEYKTSGRDILPIPCITCHAEVWELWVCYRSNDDCKNPTYELEKILGGDMSDLWSCVQLVYILERLRNWALDTFRPWVHRYLVPWIEHCGLNEKKPSRLPNKNVKLYPGGGNGFGGSLDDSGYCTGDDSDSDEDEIKVEHEDDDEESPYYDYEGGNILPEILTRRTPKKEGGLGHIPTRQKYNPLIDSQLEQIPEIEKVYSGNIETAVRDPRTNKIKEYIFYHAKWKDCWVTREYIARSPEKYAGAKIRRTNRVIRHGWPVELYFIQFEEVWIHKDKLNKYERKLARREAGA